MIGGLLAASPLWAADITPATRKDIVVFPPPKDEIFVPEQYRGIHEVIPNRYYESKEEMEKDPDVNKPEKVNFTLEYRGGFLRGWRDFLEWFHHGDFDLDEMMNPERIPIAPFSTGGPSAYYPGQRAGALACRDELLALARKRSLTFLPARPAWLKKLVAAGGSNSELNVAGNPTYVSWSSTSRNQPISDDDLKLLGEIPMADVKRLSFTGIAITDAGLASLPPMPQLTHLEINGTGLTGAGLANIPPMPQLTHLELNGDLTSAGIARLPAMPQLTHLVLGGSKLTGTCLHTLDRFSRLTNLSVVDLRSVTAGDFDAVQKLSGLESLDLCAVEIGDDAIPIFLALPKLTDLHLNWAYDGSRGAKLSSSAIARLGGCSHLKVLILSGCAVDDASLRAISVGLHDLRVLSLAKTLVTDESICSIQKLQQLESLSLSHTRVTDAGIAALASHPSIKTLVLDDTRISDQALTTLATLPKIKEIYVLRGQLSEKALAAFRVGKPGVQVMQFKD